MSESNRIIPFPRFHLPGYEVTREIGKGGMSTVYLAVQECIGRDVALKVMSPSLCAEPGFSDKFLHEAKVLASLSHPHIIPVFDVGRVGQFHYFSMEYHQGGDLKARMKQGLSTDQAVLIVKQLALALDYAHRKGYLHRDVKPDNVLFREDGSAVLTDFGIARAFQGNGITLEGKIVGTPKYMSPEQAHGKPQDTRSDLYSLGIVFYEMLTGQVPFDGSDPISIGIKHVKEPVPPLPADLADFQPVIDGLLAKYPGRRFQSGEALIAALEEAEFYYSGQIQRAAVDTIGLRTKAANEQEQEEHKAIVEALEQSDDKSHKQRKGVIGNKIKWLAVLSIALYLANRPEAQPYLQPLLSQYWVNSEAEQLLKALLQQPLVTAGIERIHMWSAQIGAISQPLIDQVSEQTQQYWQQLKIWINEITK